jgi:hypothetical protein
MGLIYDTSRVEINSDNPTCNDISSEGGILSSHNELFGVEGWSCPLKIENLVVNTKIIFLIDWL